MEQNKRSSGRKNKRSSEPEHKEGGSEPMPEEKGRSEPMPEHNEKSSEPMPVSLKLYILYCLSSLVMFLHFSHWLCIYYCQPAMETDETPEWLPQGWIMEVKVKTNSLRKYKVLKETNLLVFVNSYLHAFCSFPFCFAS